MTPETFAKAEEAVGHLKAAIEILEEMGEDKVRGILCTLVALTLSGDEEAIEEVFALTGAISIKSYAKMKARRAGLDASALTQ